MIKVEHTKAYKVETYLPDTLKQAVKSKLEKEILVAPAKLVLAECIPEEALLVKHIYDNHYEILISFNPNQVVTNEGSGAPMKYWKFYKPIFISETEKIEDGDWIVLNGQIQKVGRDGVRNLEEAIKFYNWSCYKILALSEHSSPQQLQMIVDGKLKDGNKILVECEQEQPIPMDYHGVDSRGDYKYYCPKCGHGGSYMGTGQVHCYKDECRATTIKLNPHITIYPVKEEKLTYQEWFEKYRDQLLGIPKENPTEKMVPLSLVEKAFEAGVSLGFAQASPDQSIMYTPLSKEDWFKQNVKEGR